jgi:hypothetical protein
MSRTLTATENLGTQGGRAALAHSCQMEERPVKGHVHTFGAGLGGCQCVVLPQALAQTHSYPFQWADESEGFGCST